MQSWLLSYRGEKGLGGMRKPLLYVVLTAEQHVAAGALDLSGRTKDG